jgi:hypothetical protein
MKKTNLQLQLILLIMLFCTAVRAQTLNLTQYITDINAQMNNIPVVFEGQIQSVRIFAGDEFGNPLTSNDIVWNGEVGYWQMANGKQGFGYSEALIKVCKTYKGEIPLDENGMYKVLTKSYSLHNIYRMKRENGTGGTDKYTYVPSQHPRFGAVNEKVFLPADSYPKQIFFCKKVDPVVPPNYAAEDYHYSNFMSLYECSFNMPITIPQPGGNGIKTNAYCALFDYAFNSQADLQTFLSLINGVNPNPENFCGNEGSVEKEKPKLTETVIVNYNENVKNYNAKMEQLKERVNLNANHIGKKNSAIYDLNLDMANERILEIGGNTWFEFDVMASTNQSSTYFDNCLMRIQYNTVAFGTNAMPSNVVITRVGGFNTSTYANPQTQSVNHTNNTLGIPFGALSSAASWNRVLLTSIPTKMLTIRIKVISCGQPANLTFVDQATTSGLSYYTTTANTNWVNGIAFDNTNYTGNITDATCEPIITGFTNNVPAGIGRHLVITGKYFGSAMGDGTVIFKDADFGTVYPPINQGVHNCGIQPYDVVSWTDNKIVIKLPSIIDSAYSYDIINNVLVPQNFISRVYPGSGKFIVQNFTVSRKESTTPLTIPFSLANVIAPNTSAPTGLYRKKPVKITAPNASVTGYNIQFHPNVATFNGSMKPVFRRAMLNWSCVSSINWSIGNDVNAGSVLNDNINQVMMGPSNMSSGVIMQTNNGIAACVNGGVETWYEKTFDILINPNKVWAYDTTGINLATGSYDFFQTAMHELGHAHTVWHINDSINDIMFWFQNASAAVNQNRKNIYSSSDAVSAGQHVTDSLRNGVSCETNMVLFFPTNCAGAPNPATGVRKVKGELAEISVFPNPSEVSQNINIHFKLQNEQKVSFKLYGISGNLIRSVEPVSYTDEVDYVFDTGNLSEGMYLLTVNIGNKHETFKIVKQ